MEQTNKYNLYKGNVSSIVVIRLLLILFILSISRMCLYFFNVQLFAGFSALKILRVYFTGLRFDISVVFMLGALLIMANSVPFGSRRNVIYQKVINTITLVVVSLAVTLNISDAVYYRFTLKRMTADIFHYMKMNGGFLDVAPRFFVDFWYATLTGAFLIIAMVFLYIHICLNRKIAKLGWRFYTRQSLFLLLSAAIIVVGIRGGWQLKPINIVDAGLAAPNKLVPLVLNTPFTIIKSAGQKGLPLKNDFSEEELKKIFNPIRSYQAIGQKPAYVKNVVVLILESFSAEHIGYLSHHRSFTPFLDSLFPHCLVFKGTSNGKRSIEGIPAVLSSIPTLSNESFLAGPYAANQIEGLAATLDKHQYQTAFFHGGKNGTMSFDAYARSAGFQSYYGMNEYPNKDDYDGHWGIWDEKYLQYFAQTLDGFHPPFLAALFTLSSHHPYSIPEEYKGRFPDGSLEIQKAIAYADFSLRKFFRTARTKSWYKNTLFVMTADHTSEGAAPEYQNGLGQFSVPIAFFAPGDSLLGFRSAKMPVQQIDIFPTILQYLGMSDTVLCFGNSAFDTASPAFAVNYFNYQLQALDSTYLLQLSNNQPKYLFEYKKDSLLERNLIDSCDYSSLYRLQKAFIQQYNNRMIRNKLRADEGE